MSINDNCGTGKYQATAWVLFLKPVPPSHFRADQVQYLDEVPIPNLNPIIWRHVGARDNVV